MVKNEKTNWTPADSAFDFNAVFSAKDYLYFYETALKEEYTQQECTFLARELALEKPMKILDLACGHGRHANLIGNLGYSITGIDGNPDFLAIARKEAKKRGLDIRYMCGDIRSIAYHGEFDRVTLLFSSFGYFTDEENEKVLRNVADALTPGGLFCFDILNRDVFLKDLPRCAVRERNSDLMIDRNRFDPITGRLYNARIIIRDGIRKDLPFFLRLYNPTEIIALLEKTGLHVEKICGDWAGSPFTGESKRMIVIARKD
jgi:SAM-dependent methyltransferase